MFRVEHDTELNNNHVNLRRRSDIGPPISEFPLISEFGISQSQPGLDSCL